MNFNSESSKFNENIIFRSAGECHGLQSAVYSLKGRSACNMIIGAGII